uniref:Uncharacterized protein n=1 Tax=Mycena chlorophos TaxID=658473 RepID=A0ABQ0LE41_MYCCL|nr:predicted protein [Mycena chlorophos]
MQAKSPNSDLEAASLRTGLAGSGAMCWRRMECRPCRRGLGEKPGVDASPRHCILPGWMPRPWATTDDVRSLAGDELEPSSTDGPRHPLPRLCLCPRFAACIVGGIGGRESTTERHCELRRSPCRIIVRVAQNSTTTPLPLLWLLRKASSRWSSRAFASWGVGECGTLAHPRSLPGFLLHKRILAVSILGRQRLLFERWKLVGGREDPKKRKTNAEDVVTMSPFTTVVDREACPGRGSRRSTCRPFFVSPADATEELCVRKRRASSSSAEVLAGTFLSVDKAGARRLLAFPASSHGAAVCRAKSTISTLSTKPGRGETHAIGGVRAASLPFHQ